MITPDDIYEQIIAKLTLFFSGIAGAYVSFTRHRKMTALQRLFTLTSGGFTAMFITPVAVSFLKMGDNGTLFCAFIIGFSGFKSVEIAIDEMKKRFPSKKQ